MAESQGPFTLRLQDCANPAVLSMGTGAVFRIPAGKEILTSAAFVSNDAVRLLDAD